jgi:hypothetical protein
MVIVFIPTFEVAFAVLPRDLLEAQDVGVISRGFVEVGLACLHESQSHDAHGISLLRSVVSALASVCVYVY